MKGYKLVSHDKHKFVVQHPEGHQIILPKAGLDPRVSSKVEKLEPLKMADGGIVPDESQMDAYRTQSQAPDVGSISVNPDAPMPQNIDPAGMPGPAPGAVQSPADMINPFAVGAGQPSSDAFVPPSDAQASGAPDPIPQAAVPAPQAPAYRAAPANPQASAFPDPMKAMGQAQGLEAAGIQGTAKAQAASSAAQAKAYQDFLTQQKAVTEQYQKQYAQLDQENQQFQAAYADGKIQPNRVWTEASTGNKIMAGIGLILGGMGSALTGQPNAALGIIDKTIDRDIDAQKANIDKQKSLFSMNMERYRNTEQAEAATRLQMNSALQAQVGMAVAQSGSGLAKAQGQMLLGQLKERQAGYQMQLAESRVKAISLGAGSGDGGIPVGQEPMMLLGNKDYQKKRVIVNGKAYQTNAEDGQEMRTQEALLSPTLRAVNELNQFGPMTTLNPAQRARVDQLRAVLRGSLASLKSANVGSKRISDAEIELADHTLANPSKFSELMVSGVKNQGLIKDLIHQAEASRAANLIGYQGMNSLSTAQPGIAPRGK